MNNLSNKATFFDSESEGSNLLWQYVQSMNPETLAQLSKPTSNEVFQIMEHQIRGMLGSLPSGQFEVTITTSRASLSQLLAWAMMNGYFLRNAEQRMAFEQSLQAGSINT